MKYVLTVGFLLLAPIMEIATASAQHLPRYAALYDCTSWTRERQDKSGIGPESWMMGFLAAEAMEQLHTNQRDILSQHDVRALLAWVDNYCQSKPLDNLLIAALALTLELTNRAIDQRQAPSTR